MSVLGIDAGSANSIIATISRGAVEVIRNEVSERATPSLVGFTASERLIGEAAQAQIKSAYKNTCRGFKNLLGRVMSDPDLPLEMEHSLSSFAEAENGVVGYKVNYKGEEVVMSAPRVMAALFTKLKSIAEGSLSQKVIDVVIACPGWFTDANRAALLDAAEIAGLNCRRILSEHVATALDYGIFRSREFSPTIPQRVAFVAIGHSNTSVSVVEFLAGSLKVLSEAGDRNLGGRDLGRVIACHFGQHFLDNTGIDPLRNVKSYLKLEEQSNKTKKMLSANSEAPFHVECLAEDQDCHGRIARTKFEELCTVFLPRLQDVMQRAVDNSGVGIDAIQTVEIVGGTTRIPWVQATISKFFGKEAKKTLSFDECVARGCALQAAMCSSAYKVREFSCWEKAFHPIAISWEGAGGCVDSEETKPDAIAAKSEVANGAVGKKSAIVIEAGMVTNITRKLTFLRPSSFEVWASYADPSKLPAGTAPYLGKCAVTVDPLPNGGNREVKLRVKLNFHGLFKFDKAHLVEEEEVEETIQEKRPIEAAATTTAGTPNIENDVSQTPPVDATTVTTTTPVEEQQQFEYVSVRRKVRRPKRLDLPMEVTDYPSKLSADQVKAMKEKESLMAADDVLKGQIRDTRNDLEGYIYDMRARIEGDLKPFVDEQQVPEFLNMLEQAEDWLYNNLEISLGEFKDSYDTLKKSGDVFVSRFNNHKKLQDANLDLLSAISDFRAMARSPAEHFNHISTENRQSVIQEADAAEMWLSNMMAKQKEIPLHQVAIFSHNDITSKLNDLNNYANNIFNQPKPAPPVVTPPSKVNGDKDEPEVPVCSTNGTNEVEEEVLPKPVPKTPLGDANQMEVD